MNIYILFFIVFIFIILVVIRFKEKKRKRILEINLNSNLFIKRINKIIDKNKYNLLEERLRLKKIDAYGNENLERWIGKPPVIDVEVKKSIENSTSSFKEGIPYFWLKVIIKEFSTIELFFEMWNCYRFKNPIIKDEILNMNRKLNKEDWYIFIASLIEKSCQKLKNNSEGKKDNNYIKGLRFENYCYEKLIANGWEVKETPLSGDQGVDLIASKRNIRLCIQCKDHIKALGNKAVQEIFTGKNYWKGSHAILISKSGFTKSALKLAESNGVILINNFEIDNLDKIISEGYRNSFFI